MTGDANIHSCVSGGTRYLTSRYMPHSAASSDPTPNAIVSISTVSSGIAARCHERYDAVVTTSSTSITPSATAKSTRPVPIDAIAISKRREVDLADEMRVADEASLAAVEIAFDTNVHGSSAAKANTGYGSPSDGIFAHRPEQEREDHLHRRGAAAGTAHAAPSTVCL